MYEYRAEVLRVVDGDTIDLRIDLGFKVDARVRVRLHGVNTPETFGVKHGSAEHAAGKAASHFTSDWIRGKPGGRSHALVIKSHDGKALGVGSFGRWIVEVFRYIGVGPDFSPELDPVSLNAALLESNHAERVTYK